MGSKLRRQMQASLVLSAQNASPMAPAVLAGVGLPPRLMAGPGCETLLELLKLTQEAPQPLLDAKVSDSYRRSIPGSLPLGVDLSVIMAERARLQAQKIAQRIERVQAILKEDEQRGCLDAPGRTRLLIELKSLKLHAVQRDLREKILRATQQLRSVDMFTDRPSLRRSKKQSLREARLTERNEQLQRRDKTRKERQSYYDYLNSLVAHQRELQASWRTATQRRARLVKQVMHHHGNFEREETKRQEKIQKDRLRALKMDDEEAYLKLLDQEKDTRLTYLLRQTDEFLTGLAAKVAAQQEDTLRKLSSDVLVSPVGATGGTAAGNRLLASPSALADATIAAAILGEDEEASITTAETEEGESGKLADYWGTAHRKKELVEEQPRMLVGGRLKEYQMKGLQWMVSLYNNHLNGILADEMGLGKTIQAISLISYLVEKKAQNGPYLIIVPLSTMTNWSMEFEKWAPGINKVEYKGVPTQRKALQNQLRHGRFNVLLTTYEYVIKDRPFLSKLRWLYLIVDEGHRMKNSHSKLTTVLTQYYQTRFRLILTGTPLQNNLPELWALLNFLLPHVFNSCKSFEEWFNTPFANTGEKMELNEEEILLIIRRLHKVLRPFLLRRLKKDVEAELPDKVEMILKCPMSALQQTLYNTVAKRSASALRDPKNLGIRRLNNTIMQLRKICNHPFVFDEVEQAVNPRHVNNELLYRAAGKFELLQRILPKFKATGHKVLMFFQMTQIMTIMEDFLAMQGYAYVRLDGSTKAEDRTDLLKKFNAPDSPYFVFLLSTRAGGLGLNLQSADTVIIFDSDWNPHQDLQAQDRAHRIGQTKEVRIFRLITIESVEEYILERAQHKLSLDGKVIQAGKFDHKSTNEERDAMLRAIMEREAEKNDVEEIYGDDELNEIIARNEAELESFRKIDEDRERVEQQRLERLGIKQSRLIEAHELPPVYLKAAAIASEEQEEDGGAGDDSSASYYGGGEAAASEVRASRRKEISYNENMSDSQWLAQLERSGGGGSQDGGRVAAAAKDGAGTPTGRGRSDGLGSGSRGRKRTSQEASLGEFSGAEESSASTTPVKRVPRLKITLSRPIPATTTSRPDGLEPEVRKTIMRAIFDSVENSCDENSRYRSDLFLELPDKSLYPDYYQLIINPICLSMIETRLESSYYPSVYSLMDDLELLFANALKYNVEGSQVYDDAQAMRQLARDRLAELMEAEGCYGDESTGPDEEEGEGEGEGEDDDEDDEE